MLAAERQAMIVELIRENGSVQVESSNCRKMCGIRTSGRFGIPGCRNDNL